MIFTEKKKKFLIEKRDINKNTYFYEYDQKKFSSKVFINGYFESEKYFHQYKKELVSNLTIKNINFNNLFLDPQLIKNTNSISIAVRKNRFSESSNSTYSLNKSIKFEKLTLEYISQSISFFRKKIKNPNFFIFSDDPSGLSDFFSSQKDCTVVLNEKDKIFSDFYLSSACKHFIVGPTTFHWWSAYIANHPDKICVKPPEELKFSSNRDIYPASWIKT